jgi:hypothetical protein
MKIPGKKRTIPIRNDIIGSTGTFPSLKKLIKRIPTTVGMRKTRKSIIMGYHSINNIDFEQLLTIKFHLQNVNALFGFAWAERACDRE